MGTNVDRRLLLQETMNFLGALVSGIEEAVGEPAKSISYLAGGKLGTRFSEEAQKTPDVEQALTRLREVLAGNHCLWHFEPFQPSDRAELVQRTAEGEEEVMLVFRDCMIRQSLFKFGHAQKGSLCNLMNGFFASSLQSITDRKSRLEILHAGENACYKRLIIDQSKPGAPQRSIPG